MKRQPPSSVWFALLLTGITACGQSPTVNSSPSPTLSPLSQADPPAPASPSPTPIDSRELLKQAEDKAAGAAELSRSAQSPDDWKLVTTQYQRAIDLLGKIPPRAPEAGEASKRLSEYQKQREIASKGGVSPTASQPTEAGTGRSPRAAASAGQGQSLSRRSSADLSQIYERIGLGNSLESVQQLLGEPTRVDQISEAEYVWRGPEGTEFGVSLRDGRVNSKYHFGSNTARFYSQVESGMTLEQVEAIVGKMTRKKQATVLRYTWRNAQGAELAVMIEAGKVRGKFYGGSNGDNSFTMKGNGT